MRITGQTVIRIIDCDEAYAELREYLLKQSTTSDDIARLRRGLTSEMIAACAKLMSNLDLICCGAKMEVTAHCNTTIGLPGSYIRRAIFSSVGRRKS